MLYTDCLFHPDLSQESLTLSPGENFDEEVQEARKQHADVTSIYLEGDNVFAAPNSELTAIGRKLQETFPECHTIRCYARIPEIQEKSLDELIMLRDMGFDELNVGIESGSSLVLMIFEKGFTADAVEEQLEKLEEAGIRWSASIVAGGLGGDSFTGSAHDTADLLNRFHPYRIYYGTVYADDGSQYYNTVHDRNDFGFTENSTRALMDEEAEFLTRLDLPGVEFDGSSLTNPLPISGVLPEEQEDLIDAIRFMETIYPEEFLDAVPTRGADGCILVPERIGRAIQEKLDELEGEEE
ncbi:MAG: hypothetical protein U0K37_07280 [Acutalibacteraceae bacterium]|jgi:hypothetical protein|nr:hypothetical protein [Acutalibacteraceae bacterium]